MNNYSFDIISKVIVCFFDHYSMMKSDFLFVISNINHKINRNSKLSRNANLCKIHMERLPISSHQCIDTELLYLSAKFQTNPREEFFYLCPKLRCVRSVVRSGLLKNVRCKNGRAECQALSFNDSIKPLFIQITQVE